METSFRAETRNHLRISCCFTLEYCYNMHKFLPPCRKGRALLMSYLLAVMICGVKNLVLISNSAEWCSCCFVLCPWRRRVKLFYVLMHLTLRSVWVLWTIFGPSMEWMSKSKSSDVTYLACLTLHPDLKIINVQNRLKIIQHELRV